MSTFIEKLKSTTQLVLKTGELKGKSRKRDLVDARKIFCLIARDLTEESLEYIGSYIGKDHSTVIYACKKCEDHIVEDDRFRRKYELVLSYASEFHKLDEKDEVLDYSDLLNSNLKLKKRLAELTSRVLVLNKELDEAKENIVVNSDLTEVEKRSRKLDDRNRSVFNERSMAIVKMLEKTSYYPERKKIVGDPILSRWE